MNAIDHLKRTGNLLNDGERHELTVALQAEDLHRRLKEAEISITKNQSAGKVP